MNVYAMGDYEPEFSATINPSGFEFGIYVPQLRCHTEEVRSSGDDPILAHDCRRIVCGPTYYGEAAEDDCLEADLVTEGEGEEAITYEIHHVRTPGREESSEEWEEVRIPIDPPPSLCGTLGNIEEEASEEPSGFLNYLVPDLLAQEIGFEGVFTASDEAFSDELRQQIADKFQETADNLRTAIDAGDVTRVGESGSEHRRYFIAAWEVAQWMAHAIWPQSHDVPTALLPLHRLFHPNRDDPIRHLDPELMLYWTRSLPCFRIGTGTASQCTIAGMMALNLVKVSQELNGERKLGSLVVALAHEGTHVVNHFLDTRRSFGYGVGDATLPNGTTVTLYGNLPVRALLNVEDGRELTHEEIVPDYSDESSARMIEAIIFDSMPDGLLSQLSRSSRSDSAIFEEIFRWLTIGNRSALARVRSFGPSYAYQWEWTRMSDTRRSESPWVENFNTWVTNMVDTNGFDPPSFYKHLEEIFKRQGGFPGLVEGLPGGRRRTGSVLSLSPSIPLDWDYYVSSLFGGSPPGMTPIGGLPPDTFEDWEEPPNLGEEGFEDEGGILDPECLSEENRECALDWCAGEGPGLNDGGLCEDISEEACEDDPNQPWCSRLCDESQGEQSFCTDLCEANEDLGFCGWRCRENPNESWCDDRCENGDGWGAASGYCRTLCNEDHGPSFCGAMCDATSSLPWCEARCEEGFGTTTYCLALCAADHSPDYCGEICVGNPSQPFCTDRCNDGLGLTTYCPDICGDVENPQEINFCVELCATTGGFDFCVTGDEGGEATDDGCSSGWIYRRGSAPVAEDGCFPFVGNVKCCGNSCEPDGWNEACMGGGVWCGCDPDPSNPWVGVCLRPSCSAWSTAYGPPEFPYCWDERMQPSDDVTEFRISEFLCYRGVGAFSSVCDCEALLGAPLYCYPDDTSVPEIVRGLCCDDSGACVTRASLGLQP